MDVQTRSFVVTAKSAPSALANLVHLGYIIEGALSLSIELIGNTSDRYRVEMAVPEQGTRDRDERRYKQHEIWQYEFDRLGAEADELERRLDVIHDRRDELHRKINANSIWSTAR